MKRTSVGLSFVLAALFAGCAPEDMPPESGDSDMASPAAPAAATVQAPAGGSLQPQGGSLQAETLEAAVRRHDEAKRRAGDEPLLQPALAGFEQRRAEHGMTADDTFRIRNVQIDENGDRHVRLDHFYRGLRVVGSTGALRTDRDGGTREERSDGLRKGIAIDTKPRLSEREARAVVDARPERTGRALIEPRSELVIYPVKQRFVIATGAPVTGQEEDLNALDVETRVVEHRLAYQIDTLDQGRGAPHASHRFFVDAGTGGVLEVRSHDESVQGIGNTYMTDGPSDDFHVPLSTSNPVLLQFEPWDAYRNFGVWDNDYARLAGPNMSMTNVWGDGAIFAGDANATYQNRQTAIADADYALQGTWDMFDLVWNRRGYDGNFYEGDAYVHVDTDWDNAQYSSATGNISVGDSTGSRRSIRTAYDTLAHEFGHGLNDFTADIGGSGEPDGLNEASSDIIGQVSQAYELGLGLKNRSATIPASPGPNWVCTASGRNFKTANGVRYWYAGLADLPDEHTRALPMDHAFYFLSQGSSSNPISTTWSSYVPWGMKGIGIDHAARIWVRALLTGFNGNQDYADARASCLAAAVQLYGSGSAEHKAVQNAFAAINVGSPASDYPGSAVAQNEAESNNTEAAANGIVNGTLPAGVSAALSKRTVVVGGVSTSDLLDWFTINVPAGKHLRVTLFPQNDADLMVYDSADALVDDSINRGTSPEQVLAAAPAGSSAWFSVRVSHYSTALGQFPFYQMYVDIY
jgi:Zn-dependent metalloprotease